MIKVEKVGMLLAGNKNSLGKEQTYLSVNKKVPRDSNGCSKTKHLSQLFA